MHSPAPLLAMEEVSKSYGASRALDGVSFAARSGRVHALVGENGAGKSTLVKVMSGIVQPDGGTIRLDGEPVRLTSRNAGRHGIHIVHQELALLDELTVTQNVFIGGELRRAGLLARRTMRARTREALARLSADIDPDAPVGSLSTAGKQLVEIARGLIHDARLLILDEPTAALPPEQAESLFAVLRSLTAEGHAIVYISHRLAEVLDLADDITVLKDGRHVVTREADGLGVDELVRLMVGRELGDLFPAKRGASAVGTAAVRVRGLVDPPKLHGIDFDVDEHEIVGLYGLEGTGQDELLACLAGDRRPVRGTLELGGRPMRWRPVSRMLRAGVGYVPQDRKQEGLLLEQSSIGNVAFPILRSLSRMGVVSTSLERKAALAATKAAAVAGDVAEPAASLSGGNQQKVSLARLIAADCRLLLLNQPTRGVDVGSKEEIYALVRRLCAERGASAIVTSPELSELLGLCDRVLVLSGGRIVGEAPPDANEEDLLAMVMHR